MIALYALCKRVRTVSCGYMRFLPFANEISPTLEKRFAEIIHEQAGTVNPPQPGVQKHPG